MEYVIGIDSGGTNFRLKATDLSGNELASYTGIPANHYYMSHDEMVTRINANIEKLLSMFGGRKEDARYILCGTTGLDSEEDGILLNQTYGDIPGFNCPVTVINDAELAHYTVTGGNGILLISGTGAIAFGNNASGRTARAGGWLFTMMGDEGSGSWVSRTAMRYLGRYFDGAIAKTDFIEGLQNELNAYSRNDLNCIAHKMGMQPWVTPLLTKTVDKFASLNDEAAVSIMEEAAECIFNLLVDIETNLSLHKENPGFNIGLWGSNILNSDVMLKKFRTLTAAKYPEAVIMLPDCAAIDGAIRMALSKLRH